jgi:hypothetical protein
MCVATVGVRRPASCRGVLHTRCFALMLPAWAGLVALSFLPSNADINSYFEVARAGGAAFLLLQLVIIMDLVYSTNERWLEQDDTLSRVKLIAGAFLFNAGTVAGIVCMYVYLGVFARDIAFISVTLLLFVIFTTLSLLPRVSGGIFTSGTVAAYCVFLCSTAIMSDPAHAGAPPRWLQALGFAIALTALLHSTFSATAHARTFEVAHAAPSPRAAGCFCCGDADEDEPEEVHPLTYSFFHAVFALGVRTTLRSLPAHRQLTRCSSLLGHVRSDVVYKLERGRDVFAVGPGQGRGVALGKNRVRVGRSSHLLVDSPCAVAVPQPRLQLKPCAHEPRMPTAPRAGMHGPPGLERNAAHRIEPVTG